MGRLRLLLLAAFLLAPVWRPARAADAPPPLALGPDRGWIESIAVAPAFPADGHMWAAVFGSKIFGSVNGGQTWAPSREGETDPVVTGLTVSPSFSSDQTLFAAADDGVFRSVDAGRTWSNVSSGLGGHFARAVALSPRFAGDRLAYVATEVGVYRSADGGTSWTAPRNQLAPITSISVIDGAGQTWELAGPSLGGMLRSTDGGASWQRIAGFPQDRQVLSVGSVPGSSTILAATDAGLWRSPDSGTSWQQAGMAGDRVTSLALSPNFGRDGVSLAASASGNGLYRTSDSGNSWQPAGKPEFPFVQSLAVSPSFSVDHTVFAGTAGGGIEVSHDAGSSWRRSDVGLHGAQVVDLRQDGGRLIEAGNGGVSVQSPDGAWIDLAVPSHFVTGLDTLGNAWFLGTQDRGLLVSFDGGSNWNRTNLTGSVSAVSASHLPGDQTVLVAAGYVYASHDGGNSWQQATGIVGNDVRRFAYSPNFESDHTVFAGTVNHSVYRSTDGGMTWSVAAAGLPGDEIHALLLSPSFGSDGVVYAATAGDGIYRSADRGSTWSQLAAQPPVPVVTDLRWSESGLLIAGTEKGIFAFDGSSWNRLGGSWDDYVTVLSPDLTSRVGRVFAGTLGDGVWQVDALAAAPPSPPPTVSVGTMAAVPPPPPLTSPTPRRTTIVTTPPRSTPIPTPAPTASKPAPKLHLKLNAYPKPVVARQPALLTVSGPAYGTLQVRMASGSWNRVFESVMPKDGRAGFGFVAPRGNFSVVAVATVHGHVVTALLIVKVSSKEHD